MDLDTDMTMEKTHMEHTGMKTSRWKMRMVDTATKILTVKDMQARWNSGYKSALFALMLVSTFVSSTVATSSAKIAFNGRI